MDSDLGIQLTAARSATNSGAIQTAVLKQAHEADQQVVEMIAQSTQTLAPPPAGQGTRVDKLA